MCPRIALDDASIKRLSPPARGRVEVRDELVPALSLRVYHDGRKVWTVRLRLAGGRGSGFRRLTLGEWLPSGDGVGVSAARSRARRARAQAQLGEDPQRPRPKARKAAAGTLKALAVEFLADAGRRLRPNTLAVYRGRIEGDILPALGSRRPGQVTRSHVRELLDQVAQRSTAQAVRTRAVLGALYSWALQRDLVAASPVAGLPRPRLQAGEVVYTVEELGRIWRASIAAGTDAGRMLRLALLTGARPMELLGLRQDELDLEARLWRLPPERSKSRRGRVIPLSDQALAELRACRARAGYLFPGRVEGHRTNHPHMMLRGLRKATGIPRLCARDCRRTLATYLAEAGTPDIVVSAILGHARTTVAVTAVYLRHGYLAEARAALEAWGARLLEIGQQVAEG